MGFSYFFFILFFIFCCCSLSSVAQQPYVREANTDCDKKHNESSALGYFCNGVNRSCQAFLTLRSIPPYDTVSAISDLLGANPSEISEINSVSENATFDIYKLVIVPVTCSCYSGYYQSNASYVIKADDTYFNIANFTFQGLTTCQALRTQSGNPNYLELETNQVITVPLRCACPTKSQIDVGVNYLMSYLTDYFDDDSIISENFSVDNQLLLKANELSDADNTIYPSTTILVPLKTPPTNSQNTEPQPSPSPPSPPPANRASPPTSSSSNNSSNRRWLYALLGALGGSGFTLVFGAIIFCAISRKSKKKPLVQLEKSLAQKEIEESQEFLESLSVMVRAVKVFNFQELKKATNDFNPSCWIKGSVYRGTVNENLVAIKKMEGNVSQEINLLKKIYHSNLICLSGVCFNEGNWYLVYEFAVNGPLSDWIYHENDNGKFLNWTQRIQIMVDVATGLNYLHSFTSPSHVHKDIKSSNILLDSDLRAKLANFGLARSTRAQEDQFSLTDHIVGTIGYLAPEYLENGLISTKLDVYAFGVLLLEMLTGKEVSVFYENNLRLSDALSDVLSDEGDKSLREFMDPSMGEKYPCELATFVVRIIDRCLNKNPEARPAMDEILQLLSKTLNNSLKWELSNNIVD